MRFQSGGETVNIKQQFVGKDAEGYMRANMVISGNVPNLASGAKLTVDDYKEEFTRSAPGICMCLLRAINWYYRPEYS